MHSKGLVSPLGVVNAEGPNSPQLTELCALLDFLQTTMSTGIQAASIHKGL